MKKYLLTLIVSLILVIGLVGCSVNYQGIKETYIGAKEKYLIIKDSAGKTIKTFKKVDDKLIELDEKAKDYDKKKTVK